MQTQYHPRSEQRHFPSDNHPQSQTFIPGTQLRFSQRSILGYLWELLSNLCSYPSQVPRVGKSLFLFLYSISLLSLLLFVRVFFTVKYCPQSHSGITQVQGFFSSVLVFYFALRLEFICFFSICPVLLASKQG